jgi:hypothetical protein
MKCKRGEYLSCDLKDFEDVIQAYNDKLKPTYKLICIAKNVGFKKFRRYMIDTYEFDPDDVDRSVSVNALRKGTFYQLFLGACNMYSTRAMIDMYLSFYRLAKANKFDLKDRFLYNKVNEVKAFDKFTVQRLKERYSLIPAETIVSK